MSPRVSLTRADAQHGVHAGPHEKDEMRRGTQPPIRHEYTSRGLGRVHLLHLGKIVGEQGRDDRLKGHPGARTEQPQEPGDGEAAPQPLLC
jgi:hypothetical protein